MTRARVDERGTSALLEGWTEGEVVVDEVVASGFCLRRAGLTAANHAGFEVNGAAAELRGQGDPEARARFELLERAITINAMSAGSKSYEARSPEGRRVAWASSAEVFPESDAPDAYRHARSNGVALHVDRGRAVERAIFELAERDRVLRAWLGETTPAPIPLTGFAAVLGGATDHAFRAASFPAPPGPCFSKPLAVAGVFGFPWSPAAPLVVGYAARSTLQDALDAAARESLQQLAFLTGESIPDAPPPGGPSPLHHLEHWLYPGHHWILETWLDEGHAGLGLRTPVPSPDAEVRIVDLAKGAFVEGESRSLAVVKAISRGALPLVFGAWPLVRDLPTELRVHPIQ